MKEEETINPSLIKIIRNKFFKVVTSLFFKKSSFNLLKNNYHQLMCYHGTLLNKVAMALCFLRADLQTQKLPEIRINAHFERRNFLPPKMYSKLS